MTAPPAAALHEVQALCNGKGLLHPLSLQIAPAETVTLLGPAGSGKTWVLELLAGFRIPGSGRVMLNGEDATHWPPHRRKIGLVERGLGLFAHMTVAGHLRFAAPRQPVQRLLDAAGLARAAGQRPHDLSHGERLRLAVARALAARPSLLLLDDPIAELGSADRRTLFDLLQAAREDGGPAPAILWATARVSDGPEQADQTIVLVNGTIRQTGVPRYVYQEPADATVAALTGEINRLPGTVIAIEDDLAEIRLDAGQVVEARAGDVAPDSRCVVCIRPERIAVAAMSPDGLGRFALDARVDAATFRGDHVRLALRVGSGRSAVPIVVSRHAGLPLGQIRPLAQVAVAWQPYHAVAFRTEIGSP
jgi:putative spermidine/putrescine transport system ATP-binding protein